jgi:hypothetical protein
VPVPRQRAIVLAAVKTKPSAALNRAGPPLCATASRSSGRDGRMLRGAEPENVMDCDRPVARDSR